MRSRKVLELSSSPTGTSAAPCLDGIHVPHEVTNGEWVPAKAAGKSADMFVLQGLLSCAPGQSELFARSRVAVSTLPSVRKVQAVQPISMGFNLLRRP